MGRIGSIQQGGRRALVDSLLRPIVRWYLFYSGISVWGLAASPSSRSTSLNQAAEASEEQEDAPSTDRIDPGLTCLLPRPEAAKFHQEIIVGYRG
jgi:hypothetical protein